MTATAVPGPAPKPLDTVVSSDNIRGVTEIQRSKGSRLGASTRRELVRGSGNLFRDLGHKNADVEQFKAILAAEIIKALDKQGLSVRAAHDRTGIAAADFSRIRNADLGRFTLDRLMSILNRLGLRVEVRARVCRESASKQSRARKQAVLNPSPHVIP